MVTFKPGDMVMRNDNIWEIVGVLPGDDYDLFVIYSASIDRVEVVQAHDIELKQDPW